MDDGSNDGTRAAVSSLATDSELELVLLEQRSAGPAAARNRGLERARAPVCLFLGDDTWPRVDLLAHHRAFHARRTARADALLGRVTWAPPLDSLPFMRWLEASGLQFDYADIPETSSSEGASSTPRTSQRRPPFCRTWAASTRASATPRERTSSSGCGRARRHASRLRARRRGRALSPDRPAELAPAHVDGGEGERFDRRAPSGLADAPRPKPRHRLKAGGLAALTALPRWPVALREETWRFLCHQTFRESFWAREEERPQRVPRVGARLVPRATREARAASSPARENGLLAGIALNQLVRFEPVLALARETGGATLLDVGSGSAGLAPWLGLRWSVTTVDTSYDDYGGASGPLADARRLPFPDRSFDVTVAVDLLEHVPAADRAHVLAELCRVTTRRAIVAGPAGVAALAVDARLAELYRRRADEVRGR